MPPRDLLSAQEASDSVGYPIEITDYDEDAETGTISEHYVYDVNDTTTVYALVQIEQNGFKPAGAVAEGDTAQASYEWEKEFSKDSITAVEGVGEDAFIFDQIGQLHMIYGDYYIIVGFDADIYDEIQDGPLNTELGLKIIENLKNKLG